MPKRDAKRRDRRLPGDRRLLAALVMVLLAAAGVIAYVSVTRGGDGTPGVLGEEVTITSWPTVAPAFTPDQLTALPTNAWITNGGTLYNQRYSPLDQIDDNNVGQLKGKWMTDLHGSGIAGKNSAEAQPIYYNGVLYVPTGMDDVFAVDVDTGSIIWKYEGNLDPAINTVCCGWLSRGVALGEGKVFLGRLDGTLAAIDQQTGRELWRTDVREFRDADGNRIAPWRKGIVLTHAPLYYNGMVIVGYSGGEFSVRGAVQAFNAQTGQLVWRFWTVPGPGEVGHDSWPADNDAWKHGGATVWQTPAVDPELGLLYFSTANASPDLDGSRRAGQNLFAASIVAIEANTGRYRWHYQEVHHDIWDYDAPSPVVLFDIEISGERRKGLAQPGKTGWVYLLDRVTGKPLLPIPERPVLQDATQKTWPTQPIPSYPQFISIQVTDAHFEQAVALIRRRMEAAGLPMPPVRRATEMFTPFSGNEAVVMIPGPQGGNNWPPMSYNPERELFFVCAQGGVSGFGQAVRIGAEEQEGERAIGGAFYSLGFGMNGTFTAIEADTGRIEWQHKWPESCYSGTVTTAGDLVFVGRNTGELESYDANDGERLWSFQTGSGANSTPTIFMHEGKQYIAFVSGGNSLGGTAKGDNLWLFSLDGTLGPADAGTGAGTGLHAGDEATPPPSPTPENPTPPTTGDPDRGSIVFANNCATCHGPNGGGGTGPSLVNSTDFNIVVAQVTNGGGGMPAFGATLTQQQIYDVAAYVTQRIAAQR